MRICPKCGRKFDRLLALSREDNKTMICDDCGERGKCKNINAKQVWAVNQRNGCDYFSGELINIEWNKAISMGYRPSTFSK